MNPSDEDIGRMQQEAVRRVRDMQQRAKNMTASRNNRPSQTQQQEHQASIKEENEPKAETESSSFSTELENRPNDALMGLFKDKEKSLIILLLVLLGGEEENSGLMLALLYLLI